MGLSFVPFVTFVLLAMLDFPILSDGSNGRQTQTNKQHNDNSIRLESALNGSKVCPFRLVVLAMLDFCVICGRACVLNLFRSLWFRMILAC